MILDNELVFSNAQAIHTTATVHSTNSYDFGNSVHDIGTGESMYLVCQVTTATADTDSNATTTVLIQEGDSSTFSDASTAVTVGTIASPTAATAAPLIYRLSPGAITKRHIRVTYSTAGGPLSAGAVDTYLVKDIQKWTAKPNAAGASLPHEA